jgi:hypothetical protein
VVEPDVAFEAQLVAWLVEIRHGHAVAEYIVQPAHVGRLWRDTHLRFKQFLVVAVARPEHQPVLTKRHRPPVAVSRDVADGEQGHCGFAGSSAAIQREDSDDCFSRRPEQG